MATTSADIQAIIDSKVALILTIIATITDITASPKPSYSIDGQSVSWESYLGRLVESQRVETECLKTLYQLMNVIEPYSFISRGV